MKVRLGDVLRECKRRGIRFGSDLKYSTKLFDLGAVENKLLKKSFDKWLQKTREMFWDRNLPRSQYGNILQHLKSDKAPEYQKFKSMFDKIYDTLYGIEEEMNRYLKDKKMK